MKSLHPIKSLKEFNKKHPLKSIPSDLKEIFAAKKKNQEADSEAETQTETLKRGVIHKGVLTGSVLILAVVMIFAMTAAWYSNVVQTTGLIFNVTEWGLNSNVNIAGELTNASPGESGSIKVEVYNSSENIIDVSFNVNKLGMYNESIDMRKRMYFYIDDTVTLNGETVERVYVNSQEDFSYTLLPKQTLIMDEGESGASLKWEWVYDVLGYYFYGTVTSGSEAQITEYLRPIVYDYESATFSNGVLETVDGVTTVAEFINNLSNSDGYSGSGATSVVASDGRVYYRVNADDNGLGVWIYCNSLNEIEYENVVDTGIGNASELMRSFRTDLNVLAEQKKLTVATVSTADELKAALTDDEHNTVVLSANVQLDETVSITAGSEKIIDLAEYTISTALTNNLISAKEGSSLTVMNGTLEGNAAHTGALINAVGSNVALSGVTITDVADAVWIADQNASDQDTVMTITDSKIYCRDSGVFIKGNGSVTDTYTYLTVENTEIISEANFGIVGNGSVLTAGNYGTHITVRNCNITAVSAAIYHPQRDSVLVVESSVLKAFVPIAVKGGSVTVKDSEVTAIECDGVTIEEPTLLMNGYSTTGSALYVETAYSYPTDVTLTGANKFTSLSGVDAIILYESTNEKYSVTVSGGTYSSSVASFLAAGCIETKQADGSYTVTAG